MSNPFVIARLFARRGHREVPRMDRAAATLMAVLHELRGKSLVWCAPERCHADVLIVLVNR
jgi:hypothetical protein